MKWYLDSGCSRHMTGDPSIFVELQSLNGEKVSFRGNNKGKIVGKGTVEIGGLKINEMSLVKWLNYNLISISQLCDSGFRINFQEDTCSWTSKDYSQTFTRRRHRNIYLLWLRSFARKYSPFGKYFPGSHFFEKWFLGIQFSSVRLKFEKVSENIFWCSATADPVAFGDRWCPAIGGGGRRPAAATSDRRRPTINFLSHGKYFLSHGQFCLHFGGK